MDTWNVKTTSSIKHVKIAILKKKLMMNILITNYAWYDKFFRYIHMTVAVITPMLAFISQLGIGTAQIDTLTVVTSGIVAGMIKIKDHLKYDKIKDQAKQQSAKYQQLYQHIDRETSKSTKQNGDEFVSWINREFSIIETDDPELTSKLYKKYVNMCKEKNIPVDDDLQEITELMVEKVPAPDMNSAGTTLTTSTIATEIVPSDNTNTNGDIPIPALKIDFQTKQIAKENYKKTLKSITPRADLAWINERANID
jgi:hypothetical protein